MESLETEIVGQERRRGRNGNILINRAERERLLELYDQSELNQVDFAKEHGINYNTLVGWLYHRRKRQGTQAKPKQSRRVNFSEVMIRSKASEPPASIWIKLPNGIELQTDGSTPVQTTANLIKHLLGG